MAKSSLLQLSESDEFELHCSNALRNRIRRALGISHTLFPLCMSVLRHEDTPATELLDTHHDRGLAREDIYVLS